MSRRTDVLTFRIPGPPAAKQRPRRGRGGRWYTPKATREYEARVADTARMALLRHGAQSWPMDATYDVSVEIHSQRRMDVDNVLKAVLDGLQGVLWKNDGQVKAVEIERYDEDGEDEGLWVTVKVM